MELSDLEYEPSLLADTPVLEYEPELILTQGSGFTVQG